MTTARLSWLSSRRVIGVVLAVVAAFAIARWCKHDSSPERRARVVEVDNASVIALPSKTEPQLVLTGAYEFEEGQFLATPPGGEAPKGFLLKVRSSEESDGRTMVETTPASLFEAVPQGSLVANPSDFELAPAKSEVDHFALTALRTDAGPRMVAKNDEGGLFSFPVGAHLECEGPDGKPDGEKLRLSGSLARPIEPVFDMRWKKRRPKARWIESAETGLRGEVRGRVEASAASKCVAEAHAKVKMPVLLAVVPAGPVPVPIWVEVHAGVHANAAVEAKARAVIEAAINGFAGVEYGDGSLAAVVTVGREASIKLVTKPPKGTATVTMKPGVSIEAGWRGPIGKLAARAHLGLEVTAEPKYEPDKEPSTQICFPIAMKGTIAFHLPLRHRPIVERTAKYPRPKNGVPPPPKCIAVGRKPKDEDDG